VPRRIPDANALRDVPPCREETVERDWRDGARRRASFRRLREDELVRAGAYRVYENPLDLLHHLDEVGVRAAR
jgi:hypothetical protein